MTRGAPAEVPPPIVHRAELTEMEVCLLQMPADRLVVLGRIADATLHPLRDLRVERRARALQHAAVRGVANERVMEAERRLADERASVRFEKLAPAEALQSAVEVVGVGPQQVRHRGT
jgi:1,6-anhydro-N-acetylmuramate kinase